MANEVISAAILAEVEAEVRRAHAKHGANSILNPAMPDEVRLPVLVEEIGEVARAMLEGAEASHLRAELIQVAAVALTWVVAMGMPSTVRPQQGQSQRPPGVI